jgi:biotin carboxyl carrier protein
VRYYVKLAASAADPIVVDIHDLPSGALSVTVDGRKVDADVVPLGEQLSIRVDGRVVDLTTEGAGPAVGIIGRGYRTYVEVESERQRAASSVKKAGGGSSENLVRAPMPGRIVKVLVTKGDAVTAGQPLVVMEAMKMENEIRAKAAATIAVVHVAAGATVEGGAKLVTLG